MSAKSMPVMVVPDPAAATPEPPRIDVPKVGVVYRDQGTPEQRKAKKKKRKASNASRMRNRR